MEATNADVLGPVDWLVVEFPAEKANFSGDMARELKSRTAAVVGTATVVSHGVNRRMDRREDRRDMRRYDRGVFR